LGLTKTAITRPVFILMLMVAALLIGTISYRGMRVEQNPDVSFGVVNVSVAYPGADADTISNLVARPIEESISGVNNLREVTSTSREGFCSVTATFEIGSDINVAVDDVRSRVDSTVGNLPKDALKPEISKFDSSSSPVMNLAFNSTTLSPRDLRDLMDNKIKNRFSQIPGVASASVSGGDQREVQIQVNKDKLLSYGIGINDVQQALSSASLDIPGGHMVNNESDITVRLKGEFENVEDIKHLVFSVKSNTGGRPQIVRLSDVATILDTAAEKTGDSRLNGSSTVVLNIQKIKEGNSVEIGDAAKALIPQIQKDYSEYGLGVQVVYEEGKGISESLADLRFSLIFGVFLVALTVYVFLHNFRGMMIVAIAIPLCIFTTFIGLRAAGFTINAMSMMALSLAIGVLVDDAIVVLENIYRHLRMGESPRDAAINGRSEIGMAAIAITFVDVVVFTPIGFMGGIVGQFFKPLALSFVFAVLSSLFVSFTVTPMLAARWYRKGEDVEHVTGGFAVWFEHRFSALQRFYGRVLEWALTHRWFVFILGNIALVAVIVFMIGSSQPVLFGKDPKTGQPIGAIPLGITLTEMAFVVGLVVFGAQYWSRAWQSWMKPAIAWPLTVISIPVMGKVLSGVMGPMGGMMAVFVGPLATWAIFGIVAWIANIFRTHAKGRIPLNALGFGLIFPVAAVVGFGYGMYKAPIGSKTPEGVFKFQFMPDQDPGQVSVNVEMPPGSSLQKTSGVLAGLEKVVMQNPNVEYVLTNVGSQSGGFSGGGNSGSNYGQLSITLWDKPAFTDKLHLTHTPDAKRDRSSDSVAADLANAIGRVPGAQVTVSASSTGFGSPIQMTFISDNRQELVDTANKIKLALQQGVVPGVINPDISSKPGKPEVRAIPDRARLADTGLTPAEVGASLRTLYQGNNDAKLRQKGLEYPIRVMLSLKDRNNPNILAQLPVKFDNGTPVMLGDVTTLQNASGIDKIDRRDRQEEVRLSADLLPGYAAGNAQGAINKYIADNKLVPADVRQKALGQADAQAREGAYLFGALFLGFFLVYMLLASLYDNLLYPAIIQLAQPQAMVGALLALVICNMSLNIVGMIGIICLVGLVGKNAILLVDYTNTLRSRGRNRHDALVESGPTRLRPIMMTTIALVMGTLPVALALGRGSEFRQTIGVAIIGGISLSTVLTLVVIPCSYTIFDDLSRYIARLLHRGGPEEWASPELPDEDISSESDRREPVAV
jgi:multidrug efflux pump subunit AcrB